MNWNLIGLSQIHKQFTSSLYIALPIIPCIIYLTALFCPKVSPKLCLLSNMDFETLSKLLETLEDGNLRQILTDFPQKLEMKDERIVQLENRVASLEHCVSQQEKYSSKDCIIIENVPLRRSDQPLTHQVCQFFSKFLQCLTQPSNFKACHPLGPWKELNYPPAIIVKYVYFGEKNEIYGRRSWLSQVKNPINGRPIFIKERLPKAQKEIKDYADEQGLITTTNNCDVKLFYKKTTEDFDQ